MICPECNKELKRFYSTKYSHLGHHHKSKCKYRTRSDYHQLRWGCWLPTSIGMISNDKYREIEEYMKANNYIDVDNKFKLPNDAELVYYRS
jgi:hypothetical protein